jgi:hypothetical protein
MEVHLSERMKAILASPNAREQLAAAFGQTVQPQTRVNFGVTVTTTQLGNQSVPAVRTGAQANQNG